MPDGFDDTILTRAMRRLALLGLLACAALVVSLVAGCGGGSQTASTGEADGGGSSAAGTQGLGAPVAYAQVQAVFAKYGCTGCHPGVNPALDLQQGKSYDDLVGVQALEDPNLYRVVAGDPGRSFLYLKMGGDAPVADIPAIGTRMPPRAAAVDPADLDLVRRWILQGAKDADGQTGGPKVPSPGDPPTSLNVPLATSKTGTGTITGSVIGQTRAPIDGALVTLLLKGSDLPGGEEHYRVAVTGADGTFTIPDAPSGQYLLKAYAPNTIYVSRIVALDDGESQNVDFGLPDRVVENPAISNPTVARSGSGINVSMVVKGSDLDPNYTLAVNVNAGLVFELANATAPEQPGTWSATTDKTLGGRWIFLAVDKTCNVSDFLTVDG
jgi:hypothetical protein